MTDDLRNFLTRHLPRHSDTATWAGGKMPLAIHCYLSADCPPMRYVVSARCIVWRGTNVLVCRNRDSVHVLPGGRLEEGETPEQALRRELLEETGWRVGDLRPLGFMHLRHLGPRPEGYRFPYPDFVWLIFRAHAIGRIEGPTHDDYEFEAKFMSVQEARAQPLSADCRLYLEAALIEPIAGQ